MLRNSFKGSIVLECDLEYKVINIIKNTVDDNLRLGDSLISLFHEYSHKTYFDITSEVNEFEVTSGKKLKLLNQKEVFLFAVKKNDLILVFMEMFDDDITSRFEEIMKMNNQHINTIRSLYKKLAQEKDSVEMFEEIMKLNSELINARRELSQQYHTIKKLNNELEIINYTDYLTKIWNRRKFFVDTYERVKNKNLYLYMMDFNNFKIINDQYGHNKGDEVLKYFSTEVSDIIRDFNGTLYRLGGDEFAVLVDESDEFDFEKLISPVEEELQKIDANLGIAFGKVLLTSDNTNENRKVEESMSIADQQMYIMKQESKKG